LRVQGMVLERYSPEPVVQAKAGAYADHLRQHFGLGKTDVMQPQRESNAH
jgi:hypothetical protein